jgi:hypothetical protein
MDSTEAPGEDESAAKFLHGIPAPEANASKVQKWIRSWFDRRSVQLGVLEHTINKIYWDGQDIRRQTQNDLVWNFTSLGFGFYARRLAHDIVEARRAEEASSHCPD